MKSFSITLNKTPYQVNVIGPMDKYGEDQKIYFSEIPLLEFKGEDNKTVSYDILQIFNAESKIKFMDKVISVEDRQRINEELIKVFPDNYLNGFRNLAKSRKSRM